MPGCDGQPNGFMILYGCPLFTVDTANISYVPGIDFDFIYKSICQMSASVSPLSETPLPKILLLEIDVVMLYISNLLKGLTSLQLIDSAGTRADKKLKTLLL